MKSKYNNEFNWFSYSLNCLLFSCCSDVTDMAILSITVYMRLLSSPELRWVVWPLDLLLKSILKHDWSWHLFRKPITSINIKKKILFIINIYSVLYLILCRWPSMVLKEINPKTSWKHLWLRRHLMEQNSKN